MKASYCTILMATALGIVACARVDDLPASTITSRTAAAPSPKPTSGIGQSGRDKTGGAALIYSRSGGFAGVFEEWTIYPDGRVISNEGKESRVSAEEVATLLADIERAGFFDWAIPRDSIVSCPDCFTYSLTIDSGGRVGSITFTDGSANVPDAAWEEIQRIRGFLASLAG